MENLGELSLGEHNYSLHSVIRGNDFSFEARLKNKCVASVSLTPEKERSIAHIGVALNESPNVLPIHHVLPLFSTLLDKLAVFSKEKQIKQVRLVAIPELVRLVLKKGYVFSSEEDKESFNKRTKTDDFCYMLHKNL